MNSLKNLKSPIMGSKQMPTIQISSVVQKSRSSNRETPSKYADFTKSGIIESQKYTKFRVGGETPLTQKHLIPKPNDSLKT